MAILSLGNSVGRVFYNCKCFWVVTYNTESVSVSSDCEVMSIFNTDSTGIAFKDHVSL